MKDPKRPFIIEFDSDEEKEKFIDWANSKEKDNSESVKRARDLLKEVKADTSIKGINFLEEPNVVAVVKGKDVILHREKNSYKRKRRERGAIENAVEINTGRK